MAANAKYSFQITADTVQAKKAVSDLFQSINKLSEKSMGQSFLDVNLNKAVKSAQELKYHLNQALDVNTGKLNLNVFSQSLKDADQSASQLMQNLLQGGEQGRQTFVALAGAIAQSEVPLKKTNETLKSFAQTLKNTVKWEISSNIVHGLESALQGAVSYAKNLNSSLTDIRIVTGKSVEDMTKFAQQANTAAKALSTTTKAYADASLIYYQQGDDEETVAKKAALTIKAANASANTSAAEMSEYLTAVWNSYQVGADELERYVDIMAALGAKTATSLEEIATSMQKVAATGNTVGVSMEQVSSIIATVSSVTRESAESIGTSYKTIFARIGDLKLGETLEDGVSLGKVSASLESVGVEILDATGDLRDMGDIITDLGDKWQTMSNAEKTAVAQVVAGKRQYTQLMALFENWDMYQENMNIASDSEGSLQEMADIYAESWEAASARATAALESIYSQIINDQAIIKVTNAITGLTNGISAFIDGMGGLSGALLKIGSLGLAVFKDRIAKGVNEAKDSVVTFMSQFKGKGFKESIKAIVGGNTKTNEQIRYQQNLKERRADMDKVVTKEGSVESVALEGAKKLIDYKSKLIDVESNLSDAQKARASAAIATLSSEQSKLVELVADYENLSKSLEKLEKSGKTSVIRAMEDDMRQSNILQKGDEIQKFFDDIMTSDAKVPGDWGVGFGNMEGNAYAKNVTGYSSAQDALTKSLGDSAAIENAVAHLKNYEDTIEDVGERAKAVEQVVEILKQELSEEAQTDAFREAGTDIEKLKEYLKTAGRAAQDFQDQWDTIANNLANDENFSRVGRQMQDLKNGLFEQAGRKANAAFAKGGQQFNVQEWEKKVDDFLGKSSPGAQKFGKIATEVAGSVMSIADGFSAATSAVQVFNDETATLGSKIGAVSSGISSLVSGFMSGGPWGLALTAVAMIVAGIIESVQQAKAAYQEAQQADFDKIHTQVDEKTTEFEQNASLIRSYNQLYETYITTGEGQDALAESARALAEAYGLVGANVLIATGNYKEFNKLLLNNMGFTDLEKFYAKQEYDLFKGFETKKQSKNSIYAVEGDTEAYDVNRDQRLQFSDNIYEGQSASEASGYNQSQYDTSNAFRVKGIDAFRKNNEFASLEDRKGVFTGDDYLFDASQIENIYNEIQTYYNGNLERANAEFTEFLQSVGGEQILTPEFKQQLESGELTDPGAMFDALGGETFNSIKLTTDEAINDFAAWIGDYNKSADQYAHSLYEQYSSEMTQFDVSQFFDSEGNFKANNGEELYSQWKALGEELASVRKKKDEVEEILKDDSITGAERSVIEGQLKYYTEIEKLYSEVYESEDNADIQARVEEIDKVKEQQRQIAVLKKNLAEFMGSSEGNTEFSDFINKMGNVEGTIDQMANTYEELQGYLETDDRGNYIKTDGGYKVAEKYKDAYEKAKAAIAADFAETYTAFDEYLYIYEDIIGLFGENSQTIFELIQSEGIKKASEITNSLTTAIQSIIASLGEGEQLVLTEDELVKQIIATNKERESSQTKKTQADIVKQAASLLDGELTSDTSDQLYDMLWGDEQFTDLMDWDQFVNLTNDMRKRYLQSYSEGKSQEYIDSTEEIRRASGHSYSEWLGSLAEQGESINTLQDSSEYFEAFKAYLAEGKKTKGWTWDEQAQKFIDEKQQQITDEQIEDWRSNFHDYLKSSTQVTPTWTQDAQNQDWKEILSDTYQYETGMALKAEFQEDDNRYQSAKLMSAQDTETNIEKISRLTEHMEVLNKEFTTYAATGRMSADAMRAFTDAGIDVKDIKTTEDYLAKIKEINKTREQALENQKTAYKTTYNEEYDPDKVWTDEQKKTPAYTAWQEIRDLQIDMAKTETEIWDSVVANGQTAIDQMENKVKNLKEEANEYKDAAEILGKSIETGEISGENRNKFVEWGIDLSGWDDAADAAARAAIAADLYTQAAEKAKNIGTELSEVYTSASTKELDLSGVDPESLFGKDKSVWNEWLTSLFEEGTIDTKELGALDDAFTAVKERLGEEDFAKLSNEEIVANVKAELATMSKEVSAYGVQVSAWAGDSIEAMFTSVEEHNANAAEQAAQDWINAFDTIKEAKEALIRGENLDEMLSDPKTVRELSKQLGYESVAAFKEAYEQGQVTEESLTLANGYIEQQVLDKYKIGDYASQSVSVDFDRMKESMAPEATIVEIQDALIAKYKEIIESAGLNPDEVISDWSYDNIPAIYQAAVSAREDILASEQMAYANKLTTGEKDVALTRADKAIEDFETVSNEENEKLTALQTILEARKNRPNGVTMQDQLGSGANALAQQAGLDNAAMLESLTEEQITTRINQSRDLLSQASSDLSSALTEVLGPDSAIELTDSERQRYQEALDSAENDAYAAEYTANEIIGPQILNEQETYEYLQGLDSQFSALDTFETEATTENLLALHDALDMSNESIRQYFSELANAESTEERELAIDNLTTAILNQSDAELTASEASDLLLQSYFDSYGIMDEYGDALSVLTVNQIKLKKATSESFKQMRNGTKPIKALGREFNTMNGALRNIRRSARNANKTFDEFVDGMEDISDADKEVFKTLNKMDEAFTDLEDDVGNAGFAEDFVNQCMEAEDGADIVGMAMDHIMSSLTSSSSDFSNIFNGMGQSFQSGVLSFSDSAIAMINEAGLNVETCMNQMKAALEAAGGNWGSVDWGTLAHTMGVDMSWILGLLEQLLQAYVDANNIPGVDVSALISAVQQAIGSAQQVHSMGGGGGGGAVNANKPSGGGGGGGGGGNKKKEDKLRFKDEVERYHVQNEVLDRVGEKLDKIDKLKDRTYGADHIKQLDAETQALWEQYAAQEALLNEANKWQAADQAELISLGVGVEFDADGNISNYEDVMQELMDRYNAEVERFNNSEQTEGDQLRLDDAKEQYEDAKQAIEDYEDAIATANDALNAMEEIQNQISENALEKITYELELNLEINERDLELLEYFQSQYEDTLDAQDELFGSLVESAAQYENNLTSIEQAYNQLMTDHQTGIINDADYAEGLSELSEQLLDNLSSLNDIKDEIAEVYANTLEMAREEIEKTTGALEHFNSTMESYITIAGLAGKEFFSIDGESITNSYRGLQAFYDAQFTNNMRRLNIQKAHLDVLLEEEEKFRAKMESGEGLSDLEKQQYEALQEQIQETRDELLSSTTETMEAVQAAYENTINAIAEDLDEFLSGSATSIEHLADQYSYFQEQQERYVSTATELYEVSKLNRQIEDSLATASTEASKEALKALQEKINKQSELNELTEYDIQMNQLQYQLLLARIQLEEAQNAKDVVRLTRDENGNYAYRYTANQDKVNEAVQKYEDVLQQINDLTVQRTSEIEQQMIEAMQNYTAMFQEISLDYTLTTEERNAKLAELQKRFEETMYYLQEQSAIATGNLTTNQEAIAENYGVSLSQITASTAGNVNANIQSMIENTQELIDAMNTAIFGENGANTAWQELMQRMGLVNQASGTAYGDMINNAEEMAEMNVFAAQEALDTLTILEETVEPLGELTEAWDAHTEAIQSAIDNYEALINEINGAAAALANLNAQGGINTGTSQSDTGTASKKHYSNPMDVITEEAIWGNTEALGNFEEKFNMFLEKDDITKEEQAELQTEFASLLNYIDSLTQSVIIGGGQLSAGGVNNSNFDSLEQNITIHAEFPNVIDQEEIIEAFMSLADKAQQFANQKN